MTKRTYLIVKPHAVNLDEVIREMITAAGLRVVADQHLTLPREIGEALYQDHRGKHFFESLVSQITGGPVVIFLIEGENAPEVLRKLAGPKEPEKAREEAEATGFQTIRSTLTDPLETFVDANSYGRAVNNCVHTPNPEEEGAVEREGRLFFPDVF